ncbi:MAG: DNA cytosine methyltransferase [Candidatus Thorarchaeota archaeon]|nr:DNA cytosine methyltransferase [Candidatus Thorarchaeota archaeon]
MLWESLSGSFVKRFFVTLTTIIPEAEEQAPEKVLYNHACATLSDLDMEVVRNVPPGGNWMDLPETTVAKSARLTQIKKSGGRTTYYGRLNEEMPSYTVNTYFNRPGNGTFIHPSQDRLISMREAARLQSFPDNYRFKGSLSSRYKQIGNAVPPLLARSIGTKIRKGLTIDLFCGAGGLSEGLEQAGHKIILASDSNPNMCETYQSNNPKTKVIQTDINKSEDVDILLENIEFKLRGRTLKLLAGGPPCQGFSTAGKWNPNDVRNSLLFKTLDFVRVLEPEYVLLENVPGIRSMQKGKLFESFITSLEAEDYKTQIYLLKAEQFGVPQRRRRVFIVANRNGTFIKDPDVRLSSIVRGRTRYDAHIDVNGLPPPVTVSEAISDLPVIASGEGNEVVKYNSAWLNSDYQRLMRGLISFKNFFTMRTKQC